MKFIQIPSFRQLSLSKQIAGTFSLIILMMVANYALINYVERSYEKNFVHTRISKYNSIHFQESIFYLQSLVNGDDRHQNDLKNEISDIDKNLQLLKEGGEYTFGNRTVEVVPERDYENALNDVIGIWQNIRTDIQEILSSPEMLRTVGDAQVQNAVLSEKFLRILRKEEQLLRFNENLSETYYTGFMEGRRRVHFLLTILTVCLIGTTFFAYFYSRNIILNPVKTLTRKLEKIAEGRTIKKSINRTEDEIGRLLIAVNKLTLSLEDISRFASEIGRGNFQSDFHLRSEEDPLGRALLEMRDNLREAAEAEELNNLITKGTALFGELTGKQYDDTEDFAYAVIKELVHFTAAIQGGFFALHTDEDGREYLRAEAAYAYGRRKYSDAKIYPGENLLGQLMIEQETLNLVDLPEGYTYITTGLGEAVPDHLLIVPLKLAGNLYGAVELAGFDVFDQHIVAFTEKISEMLASAVGEMSKSRQISELLSKSQKDTEQLRSQEEEMRQNMEEIFASQDDMHRQKKQLEAEKFLLQKAMDADSDLVAVFDSDTTCVFANRSFLTFFPTEKEEEMPRITDFFPDKSERELYFSEARKGKTTEGEITLKTIFKEQHFRFSLKPLRAQNETITHFIIRFKAEE